ncbi:HEAT repeat domain-containing protein [Nocardioides ungokensis]|uniref:HEAT repeat domain-containing protein n=1 Tax=Nocardioides ungokensis TaxID=1643322 RepID=UPI0015DE2166|nr:HEAT repeat domain-containing protein [Nocardioides ungokensis]
MTLAHLGYVAALVLLTACLVVVGCLVVVRYVADTRERRRVLVRVPVWRDVMMLSTGEPDEVGDAYDRLLSARPSERAAVEDDAFGLVPKLRGTARERLRQVLRTWGAVEEATRLTRSRSSVRRCRGLYRLGVLAERAGRDHVIAGLDDRDFSVRRTAMLALGAFPEPVVVDALLRQASREPRLRADFLSSVDRIGAPAVPVLRRGLTQSLAVTPGGDRRGFLAAEALGLVGAVTAVSSLEAALEQSSIELKLACIHALGQLGASSSVVALAGPLGHADPEVRRAAADSLGLIGGSWAVPALATVLHDDNVEVARAAANALHRCGPSGRDVLSSSTAPVAREVTALAALGSMP